MRTVTRTVLIISLLLGLTGFSAGAAEWGPWDIETPKTDPATDHSSPLDLAVRFYQNYISPVDGDRCPMYPTCSAYSRQALRKHGPLLGIFMTADRLMHEGDPLEQQEPMIKWGYKRYYDPLAYNDFWLKKQGSKKR